jgi:hypothetical protein
VRFAGSTLTQLEPDVPKVPLAATLIGVVGSNNTAPNYFRQGITMARSGILEQVRLGIDARFCNATGCFFFGVAPGYRRAGWGEGITEYGPLLGGRLGVDLGAAAVQLHIALDVYVFRDASGIDVDASRDGASLTLGMLYE